MSCQGPCLEHSYNSYNKSNKSNKSNKYIYIFIGIIIGAVIYYLYYNK